MCDYMGPFKQICEQTRHSVGQLLGEGHEQPAIVVADPVPVPSKNEQEKQVQYYSLIDTNSFLIHGTNFIILKYF